MSKESPGAFPETFSVAFLVLAAVGWTPAHRLTAEENDLADRFGSCSVSTVTGGKFGAIFTVDGQVLAADGKPVEGAIVLLRESSTSRISSEPKKYLYIEQRHLVRAPDVFARTTTDAEGRFEFRDVKSPEMPAQWSNSWRGYVMAVHRERGTGWLRLGDQRQQRRVDSNLTLVLKPTGSISGRFLAPDRTAIEGATVNVYRLIRLTRSLRGRDDLDVQMSQLTPRAQTDAQGRFTINGVPKGMVALCSIWHPDWMPGAAAIATSSDVVTGQREDRSGYLRGQPVLGVPAEVIADAGLSVEGTIVDPEEKPVRDVAVSFASAVDRETTGADGKFVLRFSEKQLRRDDNQAATSKLMILPKQESGFLARYYDAAIDDLAAEKPITIRLERGVSATGKVVTAEGEPLADVIVRPVLPSFLYGATTDSDGLFELLLPPGRHVIVFGTDQVGYSLPNRMQLYRVREEQGAVEFPHRLVDLSDGIAKDIDPLVVSKLKGIQVIASLPDGAPAVGATAIIKDQETRESGSNRSLPRPPTIIDKSDAVVTNALGRADLMPQGTTSDQAFVEVKLATDQAAYDANLPLDEAVDGVLAVVLQSAWMVEGRVLVDGAGVPGALVSIGQSTPYRRTINGRTVMGATVSNHINVTTDAEGLYRAAVKPGKEYSVSVLSLPDSPARTVISYRARIVGDGHLKVKDFAFTRGREEIAGRVVDQAGNPIGGARVQVLRRGDREPSLWVGHLSESQFETDLQGRFHLKNMPQGSHELRIEGPRDRNSRRSASTQVTVKSGEMDLGVVLALDPQIEAEPPRLIPLRIEPIEPPGS